MSEPQTKIRHLSQHRHLHAHYSTPSISPVAPYPRTRIFTVNPPSSPSQRGNSAR
ncbi:uncharacterized protein K452DRAFT_284753 [Aplosporella prunicola CBS 121167]|uniref:Uncharacterized protein n=1 Tax=Aplosporella prunicola CBS 121167 TaxID=1176127 RepID=A0A6A6BPF3_9PEZI|nr:uncharacterized protein K452DRAFT_284753 [Aplosporella prunicola CBS 121167]KAF2144431.1 hypothetical protein K452DRAFT_284753 [Aplosporella prunicola CBS 121167]